MLQLVLPYPVLLSQAIIVANNQKYDKDAYDTDENNTRDAQMTLRATRGR